MINTSAVQIIINPVFPVSIQIPPVPFGIDFYIEKDACRGSGCPVSVVRRLCHAVRIAEEKMNVKDKFGPYFSSPRGSPVDQLFVCDAEYFAQSLQFNVCHIAFVRLDPGDHILVHIVSGELKFVSEKPL